ncbi:hypothetical protein N9060_02395, partial [Arenicella sp.]|nr:hypothetical protein [Arenicella sp.]
MHFTRAAFPFRFALLALAFAGTLPVIFAQDGRAKESYPVHPDAQRQQGVPTGRVTQHTFAASKTYPGTTRDYWVCIPDQYDGT